MIKKIVVSLLSISLMAALMMSAVNPSSVMAIVGLSAVDAKTLDKVQADSIKGVSTGMTALAEKMGKSAKKIIESDDGAMVINAFKKGSEISVVISLDASVIPEFNYKDFGKVMKVAQSYLKPIFTEKQAMGLCGLLLGDAYAQYRKGKEQITISKKYEGLTIDCSGNTDTGLTVMTLKSTPGEKKCLPNKSKTMEMKALRL